MGRTEKIKIKLLGLLRVDRTDEFGAEDIFDYIETDMPSVSIDEVTDILYDYVSSGVIHTRSFGNSRDAVWQTFSLTKKPDEISYEPLSYCC